MPQKKNRDSKRESKILGVLYWRRICKQLLSVLQDLSAVKQEITAKALEVCEQAIRTFQNNNTERDLVRRLKIKKDKESLAPPGA